MKSSLAYAGLRKRFSIALVLMSVIPLLFVAYLFNQYVKVPPQEGLWILAAVIFLLLCVAAGAVIIRNVFASVVAITKGAKALAQGEVETVSVKVSEGGEVGELAQSINAIMGRIRGETSALQSSQRELEDAKTKLMESYAALQDAIDKLKKLDQMKSDFVANVAHELIHPLATLRGSLDIVLANLAQADPQKIEILEISRRNMARLIRLVTDILDISRIESGKMTLRIESIELQDMIREIVIPLEKLFKDKGIAFDRHVEVNGLRFEGDRDRLIQAVTNLLINAVKYTPAHGKVSLGVSENNRRLRFAVSDNGPGMSAADQKKLFDKFSRVTKEKQEGTGLGLCITKDIIGLHHGEIWVESQEGQGSTFAFEIPLLYAKGVGYGK